MHCCAVPCNDTNRLFSRLAGFYRWRFRVFGFEKTQKQLLRGILDAGVEHASIMEVGCGAGHLHRRLLEQGATSAIGVDISENMLNQARQLSADSALTERTRYHQGDYADLAGGLDDTDITVMDKVVCCYPDPERLLNAALPKTRHLIALTYPRDRLYTRFGIAVAAKLLKLFGSDFRPYVHNPEDIRHWITQHGFTPLSFDNVFAWQTEVYQRNL
jgi:2-polyprenyl-3-methyl-5-hydroxy-6-metoxy-1,4-benzoquinol methylase